MPSDTFLDSITSSLIYGQLKDHTIVFGRISRDIALERCEGGSLGCIEQLHSLIFLVFDAFLKCKGNDEQARTTRKGNKKKFPFYCGKYIRK